MRSLRFGNLDIVLVQQLASLLSESTKVLALVLQVGLMPGWSPGNGDGVKTFGKNA